MRARLLRACSAFVLATAVVALAGCGGSGETKTATPIPPSASLAPKNAIAFVTLVSDEGSEQWKRADHLLGLFPHARESLVAEVERELADEGLSWEKDVAPAFGPEVVVVVSADKEVIALTKPDDADALQALMRRSDEPAVSGEIAGWTAIAQKQSVIDAFRASLTQGTLADVATFRDAFETLPAHAIGRGWVDLTSAIKGLAESFEGSGPIKDTGVQDLAAALTAEEDGVLLSVGIKAPDGTGTTSYEPRLLERVPADAVVAVSFGGTQGALDKVEKAIDVEDFIGAVDDALGTSLDNVLEALSGEGVLYVRESGDEIPEVTLVLDPPNADKTWSTIEDVARTVARDGDGRIKLGTRNGRPFNQLILGNLSVVYARIDAKTMIVTTGALEDYVSDGSKLTDDAEFRAAAEKVGLGKRTSGFAYVDLDGLIPFIEGVGGPESLPDDAREVLSAMDSVILHGESDGKTARLTGFVRIPG